MKKPNILRLAAVFLLCLTLLLPAAQPAQALESGACGEGLSWVLNAGTLTVTGTGDMTDYKASELPPWYEHRENITRVVIGAGVTSIGGFAFYECKSLVSISLPKSVKRIGSYAFASCERLASVGMSGSVTDIGDGAFYGCIALASLRLPYGLSRLGKQAFYRCESLRTVSVPADVRTMGDSVFAYCKGLVRAEIHARIDELPAWTFYGCEQLSEVYLADTVGDVENYGFKKCDSLSTVFFEGTEEKAERIQAAIEEDVASFGVTGYISNEGISDTTSSGKYEENGDNTATQINTTVTQGDTLTAGYVVERVYPLASDAKGSYTADVFVSVAENTAWGDAGETVAKTLTEINNTYSSLADVKNTTVTVYMDGGVSMSDGFLDELSGRDALLVVVSTSGAGWRLDCKELEKSDPEAELGKSYGHTVEEAPRDVCESIGTDDCYRLIFDASAEQNAEVLVQLPPKTAAGSNAFLYQAGGDAGYTRLQAVAVDGDGRAHFYVASVDKTQNYVIGLNVPGESTRDVIVPSELDSAFASALSRLEKVEYVHMGRVSSWGVGMGSLTWILVGVLGGTTVLVGGIMFAWNKWKKNAQKKPEKSKS